MIATRTAGLVAGAVVALVAGLASYTHMRQLAAEHGEAWLANLMPLSVDGLLVVASLVIVTARRTGQRAPALAWLALVTGVVASLAANVANAGGDPVSKLVAAWPPLAFAVAFELVLRLVRAGRPVNEPPTEAAEAHASVESSAAADPVDEPTPAVGDIDAVQPDTTPSPGDLVDQARHLVSQASGRGEQLGRARLARELGVTEHQARRLLDQLAAESRPALHAVGGESR